MARVALTSVSCYATAEDVAFTAQLAELDRESGDWYDADVDEPPLSEVAPLSDDELVGALQGPAHPANLMLLDSIDPRSLSANLVRVEYLSALDRSDAYSASLRHKAIVSIAGVTSGEAYLAEVHVEHELAVARHISRYAAGKAIEVARALTTTFQAIAKTVQEDGDCLRIERGGAAAVIEGVEDAAADACRTDAFAARMLGTANEDGSITWDKAQVAVTVNVVMDLPTLRGEPDQIALVDGQPVPAEIGREYAQFATWWRRLLTDPVDGHLLDYGTKTYLPDKLRRFVLARDCGCRTPGCTTRAASRMQMDQRTRSRTVRLPLQLREPLHHLPPAQDRRLRRRARLPSRRVVHLGHRLGPTHPRPTPLRAPTRAGPTPERTGTTDTGGPATLLTRWSCSTNDGPGVAS